MTKEYFPDKELMCPCCNQLYFNPKTKEKLNKAREIMGMALVINSAFRCEEHNKAVGGSKTSAHLSGHAVDIKCISSVKKFKLVQALMDVGFKRIGVYKNFVHVDDDPDKPAPVLWWGKY